MEFPSTTAKQVQLESGLNCITHTDAAHPVVSLQIWVETGSQHELKSPGAGLSHLLEHMVFKGTKQFSGDELNERVEELGGRWNAYTTYDRTVYYIDGPAESTSTFLELLFELVYLPTLPEEAFALERDVIRREIAMGNDAPESVEWESHLELIYREDLRRYPIIGLIDRFDRLTHRDMVEYHESRYTFDNSFIVISGDINRSEITEQLTALCDTVPYRKRPCQILPTEPPTASSVSTFRSFAVPNYKLALSWEMPTVGHPDYFALELLASIMGGARSSPMYQLFREQKQSVLSIATWCWTPKSGPGFFAISAECEAEHYSELKSELLEYVSQFSLVGHEDDLKRAQKQAFMSQLGTLSTASGRGSDLGSNWFESRDLDFTKYYLERVQQVTIDDLQRVLDQYLKGGIHRCSVLAPERESSLESVPQSLANAVEPVETLLPNGMPLVLGYDQRLPTIHFQLIFKGGSTLETEDKEGAGALYAMMLHKGTKSTSAEQFVTRLDRLGASLNFSSGNNTFIVSGYCLRDDLSELLDLTTEVLEEPLFDPSFLEHEREVLISRVKESAQDPLKLAFWHARRELLKESPYRLSRMGSAESLQRISQNDLVEYHKSLIFNGEAVLSVFGDLDDDCLSRVNETIGRLPFSHTARDVPPPVYASGDHELTLDKEQAVVIMSYPGQSLSDEDQHMMEVIQDYLSGMTGPLFSRIREELGLSYYVSCNQFFGVNAGMFSIYLGTSPEQKELALDELKKLMQMIVEKGISESELAKMKRSFAASEAMQNQSNRSLAQSYGIDVLLGRGLDYQKSHRQRIADLEADEVSECLKKYFQDVVPVITVVSP